MKNPNEQRVGTVVRPLVRIVLVASFIIGTLLFGVGIALSSSAAWYRRNAAVSIRPWLILRYHRYGFDIPHALRSDRSVEALVKTGQSWDAVLAGSDLEATPLADEGCVLLTRYASIRERALIVCPGGRLVKIPKGTCDLLPEVESTRRVAFCNRCLYFGSHDKCTHTIRSEWLLDGTHVEHSVTIAPNLDGPPVRRPLAAPSWFN